MGPKSGAWTLILMLAGFFRISQDDMLYGLQNGGKWRLCLKKGCDMMGI